LSPSSPSSRTFGFGSDTGLFQCVLQQVLAALSPVSWSAFTTCSWFIWLIGSTPSKPASLIALNCSSTDPLTPTVAYMIAFLMFRFLRAAVFSSAAGAAGESAATASGRLPGLKNSRRFRFVFIILGALNEPSRFWLHR